MNVLLIALIIVGATAIWPVNRWVMDRRGHPALYGFWMSLTCSVCSGLLALATGQSLRNPSLWAVASATGVCHGLGFCLIIPYCLRIGPVGPTCAANNMGLLWPVLFGFFWPRRMPFHLAAVVGLLMVLASFISFAFSKTTDEKEKKKISRRWLLLALAAWVLAGISMTFQYIGARLPSTRHSPVAFVFCFSTTAAVVLLPAAVRCGKAWFRGAERIAGPVNGILLVLIGTLTLIVLKHARPEIVFSFTIAGPVLLVVLLGQFIYQERLDRAAWIGCALSLFGLLALTLGK